MSHELRLRVYYEDTDLAGIVYYANYLKFIERGRTEAVRAAGIDQSDLRARHSLVFAVRRIEADYLLPARFDDELVVLTALTRVGGASVEMRQEIRRGGNVLFAAKVRLACITPQGRAARLPADIRRRLELIGG
ncbi:MAG: tol-pal system-associated acyl-CoA thioesterase [Paracoccaceae bacterium]